MIVFRKQQHCANTAEQIAAIQKIARALKANVHDHEQATELLIEMGEMETAMMDFACSEADFENDFTRFLRSTTILAGKIFCNSWMGKNSCNGALLEKFLFHMEKLVRLPMPERVTLKISEGFAYYGLYPETYLTAAQNFYHEHQPRSVVCIGLRSIGTTLSAVVAAMLELLCTEVVAYTVRPRSEPFTRSPIWEHDFKKQLLHTNAQYYAIVDEGPGLSGSSICGVAGQLEDCGVDENKIVVFPSWVPPGEDFVNPQAQQIWPRLQKFVSNFEAVWLQSKRLTDFDAADTIDLSAGRWRNLFYSCETKYPATYPNHERRKYLFGERIASEFDPATSTNIQLYKFQGISKYGVDKFHRAEILSEAGFAPQTLGMAHGFSISRYVQGQPVHHWECDKALIERMASYLAFIAKTFPAQRAIDFDYMCHMIENNVIKSIGAELLKPLENLRPAFNSGPAVAIDGRMFPHEWIAVGSKYIKTDGECHFSDHFFPGTADIAWDVAGAIIEFKMNHQQRNYFLEQYQTKARDASIMERLDFYMLAYLAFRVGYATFACRQFGTTLDGQKFRLMANRYARLLKFHLAKF